MSVWDLLRRNSLSTYLHKTYLHKTYLHKTVLFTYGPTLEASQGQI